MERPCRFDDGERFFVHAGVDPNIDLDLQTDFASLWIRWPFLDHDEDFGRLVVHGHTIVRHGPETRHNRVAVDTGAYGSGVLTCAAFDPGCRYPRFIQAVERKNGRGVRIRKLPAGVPIPPAVSMASPSTAGSGTRPRM